MRTLEGSRTMLLAGAVVAASMGALPATTARAALLSPTCPTLNGSTASSSSTVSPSDGNPFLLCRYTLSNRVLSFDGTPLRVDLSLPTVPYIPPGSTTAAKPPLVIFQSGYSNDYCQFESTTLAGSTDAGCTDFIGTPGYHWNNAWFASNGYAAINFTPRGWYESCGRVLSSGYTYATDTACQAATSGHTGEKSWVHLLDRRWEVHDAQFLAGVVADAAAGTLINPNHIVATGDSGGGGPTWDEGLTQDQVVLTTSTANPSLVNTTPWTSPLGKALHLTAALPMYTWTDLVDSLLPNGTATDGFHGAPPVATFNHDNPIGVEKESYVAGLFARGVTNVPSQPLDGAQYALLPLQDPTADLPTWFAEINAGEPAFAVNPDTPTILAEVGGPLRSPYAMPIPANNHKTPSLNTQKPIFVMQGLTDPLFPGLQALTMINRLQAAHSHYPVWGFFGDIGHSYAQNPLDVWKQAHNESNGFLQAALQATSLTQLSQLFTQPTITVDTTRCLPQQTLQSYSANSFGSIATTQLTFVDAGAAQNTFNQSGGGPESLMSDPIVTGGKCVTMPSSTTDSHEAVYNFPVASPATLVGGPVVNVSATLIGSSAELAARLWDVDSSGNQTLITRSVVRLDQPPGNSTMPLSLQLWPNAWQLCTGDSLKLELTQTDAPTFRPDNEPSAMSFSGLKLTLPAVPGALCSASVAVAESPFVPALPLIPLGLGTVALLKRRRRSALH
ncbi:MAG: hypothetical protein JF886_12605 [Candidatus Dormibacteraeota bacterium]|uniref:Xaa-Pro dipeptidyl-peptidase C-terminal domain-containing protein n=1 Tax=Candidatus Aeolococcus gillhamiae TaxID=3127015 RepID=A0A934JVE8_9BACT|nr:hypothetical protein [Candidatus Dormibacteraeota bacterium]